MKVQVVGNQNPADAWPQPSIQITVSAEEAFNLREVLGDGRGHPLYTRLTAILADLEA